MSKFLDVGDIPKAALRLLESHSSSLSTTFINSVEEIGVDAPLGLQMIKNFYEHWFKFNDWRHSYQDLNQFALHFDLNKSPHKKLFKALVLLTLGKQIKNSNQRVVQKKDSFKFVSLLQHKDFQQWVRTLSLKEGEIFPCLAAYALSGKPFPSDFKQHFVKSAEEFFSSPKVGWRSSGKTGKQLAECLLSLRKSRDEKVLKKFDKILHQVFCQGYLCHDHIIKGFVRPWLASWVRFFIDLDIESAKGLSQGKPQPSSAKPDLKMYLQEHIVEHLFSDDHETQSLLKSSAIDLESALEKPRPVGKESGTLLESVVFQIQSRQSQGQGPTGSKDPYLTLGDALAATMGFSEEDSFHLRTDFLKALRFDVFKIPNQDREILSKGLALFESFLRHIDANKSWNPSEKTQVGRKIFAQFFKIVLEVSDFESPKAVIPHLLQRDTRYGEANMYQYFVGAKANDLQMLAEIGQKPMEIYDLELYFKLMLTFAAKLVGVVQKDFFHVFSKNLTSQQRLTFFSWLENAVFRQRDLKLCEWLEDVPYIQRNMKKALPSNKAHGSANSHLFNIDYLQSGMVELMITIYHHISLPDLSSVAQADEDLFSKLAFHKALSCFLICELLPHDLRQLKGQLVKRLKKVSKECKLEDLKDMMEEFGTFLDKEDKKR